MRIVDLPDVNNPQGNPRRKISQRQIGVLHLMYHVCVCVLDSRAIGEPSVKFGTIFWSHFFLIEINPRICHIVVHSALHILI